MSKKTKAKLTTGSAPAAASANQVSDAEPVNLAVQAAATSADIPAAASANQVPDAEPINPAVQAAATSADIPAGASANQVPDVEPVNPAVQAAATNADIPAVVNTDPDQPPADDREQGRFFRVLSPLKYGGEVYLVDEEVDLADLAADEIAALVSDGLIEQVD